MLALDLTRYHFRHTHGDITVYGTWWLASDSGPKPCLVLIPTHAQSYQRATPCVVPMNDAWVFSDTIGDPVRAAQASFAFAEALGLNVNTPQNVFRVRSIIADHIGELLLIPPMPNDMREKVVLGEAKVTAREHGKVVRHHEVIERV